MTDRNQQTGPGGLSKRATSTLASLLALLVLGIAIHFTVRWLWTFFEVESKKQDAATLRVLRTPDLLPPEPRLQPDEVSDLHRLRQSEDDILETYAWVDKDKGVVRIPVARAMSLLAQRGLPNWGTGKQPPAPAVAATAPSNGAVTHP